MYPVAKARAEKLGVDFNWQLLIVEGTDHNNAMMAPVAKCSLSRVPVSKADSWRPLLRE